MDESDVKIRERLTTLEAACAELTRRVDKTEEIVDGMRQMTVEIQHMRQTLNDFTEKVETIQQQPAKRWDSVVAAIIGAVAGGLGAGLLNTFIGG